MVDEMLGPVLLSAHNVTYYQRLMRRAREAIERGAFAEFHRERLAGWAANEPDRSSV
jgi:queuine tRNA-ribosyltransferase